jgi:hypothetical protein
MLAAAAAGVLAVVGVGALTLRGGGSASETNASQVGAVSLDNSATTLAAVGPSDNAAQSNATTTGNTTANTAAPVAAPPASEQANAAQAIAAEKAKTAVAQSQLAALKKAQAKTTQAQTASASPTVSTRRGKPASTEIIATPDAGVSPATLAQFNSTVDGARAMARDVMRSGQGQNVDTAKNYDKYLKTLKDSMRGIQTEREAQRLLKQADQTRGYIASLQRQ